MKKVTHIIFLVLISMVFGSFCFAKNKNVQAIDQIVAVVNDDVVTKSELDHALNLARMQISQERLSVPKESTLQKQVLDQVINKKLQLQIAKQAGIKVTDEDLDKAISNIAKMNHMTTATFYDRITQEGMSVTEYRTEMRDQITMRKLQQQEVVNRISISPQEVTNFMNSKIWQNYGAKEYRVEDILIPLSDTPSSEEVASAKKRAQVVITQLNQGVDYRTIEKSAGMQALQSGDLGWLKLTEVPSAFAEQVARMQAKEVAGPIQTSNGMHIIRVASVRSSGEEKAAPKRKEVENLLFQRKIEEALQNWVSKLRGQAFIVINQV